VRQRQHFLGYLVLAGEGGRAGVGGVMSKEAMKLALGKIKSARDCHPNAVNTLLFEAEEILEEALEKPDFWEGYVPEPVKPAQQEFVSPGGGYVPAIPAQQALDKKAENARELGLDYEPVWGGGPTNKDYEDAMRQRRLHQLTTPPARQEPYCYTYTENGEEYFAPPKAYVPDDAKPLYTSPPAQRKPLTDEAIATVYWGATGQSLRPQDNVLAHNFARSIEAAHGIKENT
jgi:hypothetical protein